VSAAEIIREHEQHRNTKPVSLLYICDFPPCNCHGGAILLRRLLEGYTSENLLVITSTTGMRMSNDTERLECQHISFPVLGVSRIRWFGRLKHILNWAILGLACCTALFSIVRKRVDAVLTVMHGRFYFAAALAECLTRKPYIVVVHDDFISTANQVSGFSANILFPLARLVLRSAAHVYSVSVEMQSFLRREFGVDSELQLPATAGSAVRKQCSFDTENGPVVVFAGGVTYAVEDSLNLMANLITSGCAARYGLPNLKLRLYSPISTEQVKQLRWDHKNIEIEGWVTQSELLDGLTNADILFLPYSFADSSRHAVETAFPSKTADYLASGKPILILAPNFSSLVRYAKEEGFAEIVEEFDPGTLAESIQRIASSPAYRASLAKKAHQVFYKNHDIVRQRAGFSAMLRQLASLNE